MSNKYLRYIVITGLFLIPFVPLIISSSMFFPFVTGKAFVFRVITQIILACFIALAIRDREYRPKYSRLLVSIFVFLGIVLVADIFAVNPFKAIWSNFERMEGFVAMIHFGALFLVAGSVLKTREIWNKLFATSIGASVIMIIYSFLQLGGKITINQGGVRVDGTLGNASYLAIYLVFHLFFIAVLYFRSKENWQKYLLGIIALCNLFVLYHTATRGAILGLVGGVFVAFAFLAFKSQKGSNIRKYAVWGAIALLVFVGIFASVRNTNFVKNSPVLSRFAGLSVSEIRTQGRYYVWPIAIKGFKEKPILGWGQEGFNYVFNKYYNPQMYNQEPWFDRAHSTPLDWLIASGSLGLVSYLFIFFVLLTYVFRENKTTLDEKERALVLGIISAYFFNNIFVFDQIGSYIFFFIILGFLHSVSKEEAPLWWQKLSTKVAKPFNGSGGNEISDAIIVIVFLGILYFVNWIPYRENKDLLKLLRAASQGAPSVATYKAPLSSYGMGFSEAVEHSSQSAMTLPTNPSVTAEFRKQVFDIVDAGFRKQLEVSPDDTRYRLFYGMFLSRFEFYDKAAVELKKAMELSPSKQGIIIEYGGVLLTQGKKEEALELFKKAYKLEPKNDEAKYVYALASLSIGRDDVFKDLSTSIPEDKLIFDDRYITVLVNLGRYNEVIDIAKKRIEKDEVNKKQHMITLAASYLKANRRWEAVQVLNDIIILDPSFKEQGEYYIKEINSGKNL